MSTCISDMQIVMLVAGKCSPMLRKSLSEHMLACERCRGLFAEVVKAERSSFTPMGVSGNRAGATVAPDAALIERILERSRGTIRPTVDNSPVRRIIPLRFRPREGDAAVLAAKEPTSETEEQLAVCRSEDGRYEVAFVRSSGTAGIRAVVKRNDDAEATPVRLAFPTLDLVFPLDADGRTPPMSLEGVLLESCRVDVEVENKLP